MLDMLKKSGGGAMNMIGRDDDGSPIFGVFVTTDPILIQEFAGVQEAYDQETAVVLGGGE